MLNNKRKRSSSKVDDEFDFLMELTTHPGWKILRREAERYVGTYDAVITKPAETEFDMIKKEAAIEARTGVMRFFRSIEEQVDKYAKQLHTDRT